MDRPCSQPSLIHSSSHFLFTSSFIYLHTPFIHTTSMMKFILHFETFLLAFLTGLVTTRVSVSDMLLSTWEHLSKEDDYSRGHPEEQPYTEEEITPQECGTTGDQHTASSSGSELQGDVKCETSVVMQKTSEPGTL